MLSPFLGLQILEVFPLEVNILSTVLTTLTLFKEVDHLLKWPIRQGWNLMLKVPSKLSLWCFKFGNLYKHSQKDSPHFKVIKLKNYKCSIFTVCHFQTETISLHIYIWTAAVDPNFQALFVNGFKTMSVSMTI